MAEQQISKLELNVPKAAFNPVYIPYLSEDTRMQIFFGGSSSGKSKFLAQRCVIDVCRGGRNYLIVRKVAGTIRRSCFNEITKVIEQWGLKEEFKVNQSELVITCSNGFQILFCGCDDVEKLKSITPAHGVLTDIWYEEATESEPSDVKQLEKRLRGLSKHKKRITLSFNPIMKTHWIYSTYFGKWEESKTTYCENGLAILKTTYKDNRFLSADDIFALENESDKYYYEVYSMGNWGVLGGLIFKNWEVRDLTEEKKFFDRYWNGLDFGFATDPAACVRIHYHKRSSTVYIVDEMYEKELTNDVLATQVLKMCGKDMVHCDSAEPKSIMELSNHGVRAVKARKGKDSVNFGIQWLQQQRIVVDVHCTNMQNELSQYKWKEDKMGNVVPIPCDKFNHLIDATRYCLQSEMGWLETEREEPTVSYLERRYSHLGLKYNKAKKRLHKAGSM